MQLSIAAYILKIIELKGRLLASSCENTGAVSDFRVEELS
jgi:hypothetical protein